MVGDPSYITVDKTILNRVKTCGKYEKMLLTTMDVYHSRVLEWCTVFWNTVLEWLKGIFKHSST